MSFCRISLQGKRGIALFVFAIFFVIRPISAIAVAGDLDTSLNGTGLMRIGIGTGPDTANAAVVQPDGKIILAGRSQAAGNYDFSIVRLNSNGSLDTSFDRDGKVMTAVGTADDVVYSIALQPDGKIIAAGTAGFSNTFDFAVVRYNPDGSLDSSFGNGGKVITDFATFSDDARAVAVQSDGKIVVAGRAYTQSNNDFALARYNSDGTLDTSFNFNGKVTTGLVQGSDGASAVTINPANGKIIAAGYALDNSFSTDSAFVRYNSDGSLDTAFGSLGKVTVPITPSNDAVNAVSVLSDNKIVAAGFGDGASESNSMLLRLLDSGSLDPAFNGSGFVLNNIGTGTEAALSITIQADQRIVTSGYLIEGPTYKLVVARHDTNGNLDPTFDTDGVAITQYGSGSRSHAVLRQADGKIVAVGSSDFQNSDFTAIRYNLDGTLDPAFDVDGVAFIDIGYEYSRANDVAVQHDGKIVVVGSTNTTSSGGVGLVRYHANGTLDNSFGFGGKVVTIAVGSIFLRGAFAIAIQPDGKIVVGGWGGPAGTGSDFMIARYRSDGSIDTSFDADGVALADFAFSDHARDVFIQSDGKILAVGRANMSDTVGDYAVARFNLDGSLDTSFDTDGRATISFGMDDRATTGALQPDGKIVLTGYVVTTSTSADFAIARLNANGSLDTSFDADGKVTTDFFGFSDTGYGVAVQSDGKILVSGEVAVDALTGFDLGMVRYNPNGSLDASFDTDGKLITAVGSGISTDIGYAVAVLPNGRIIAGGVAHNGLNSDFAAVRYNENGTLDPTFGGSGKKLIDFGGTADSGWGMAVDPFGRIIIVGESQYHFGITRILGTDTIDWNIAVSGRVSAGGRGVAGAVLTLTDEHGVARVAISNPFGYYRFLGVQAGRSYSLSVQSKRHTFTQPTIAIQTINDLTDTDFSAGD